ncbi:hypothetical protein D9757_005459 [Collybiopsis confluens]|uniref:Senataxin n=1 Tax=Collybiopsis confluens TaxID=2823264 RepID=A0A8H5HLX0_9AGAR|nr:hypothetical protein D9757_005459 [Collybiopsis confluens]
MVGSEPASDSTVRDLLKTFYDEPRDSTNVQESDLDAIYTYLQRSSVAKSKLHWFCPSAEASVVEAATFLLRLYAYNSPKVEIWKEWLNKCLDNCGDCVLGFERAKIGSRKTYFGAFPDDVTDSFWESFNAWELEHILSRLSDSSGWKSGVPPVVVYRMICNFFVFRSPRIQAFFDECLMTQSLYEWPQEPVAPSLLVLMMHENPALRDWAGKQASRCASLPISQNDASSLQYSEALEIILLPFAKAHSDASPVRLVTDLTTLWSSFQSILRIVHPNHLSFLSSKGLDVRHVVAGHLHDHGSEFETVLRCFHLVLKRLGSSIWLGESPEYPQVVFDAFKDNRRLESLLSDKDLLAERNPWFFNWLSEFLLSIRELPAYSEVVAKIADFMFEELQHERFATARPIIMACASRLLKGQNLDGNNSAVLNALDIHAEVLLTVTFSISHHNSEWKAARDATRDLLRSVMMQDVKNVRDAIQRLCLVLAKPRDDSKGYDCLAPLTIREQIWTRLYDHLKPTDSEGLASVLSVLASASHFDTILKESFASVLSLPGCSTLIDTVNQSLTVIRSGFSEFASGYEFSLAAPQVIGHAGVARDLVKLMLSPAAELHSGAMGIATQADEDTADGRRDCFKSLFEKFPEEAFVGSSEMLQAFHEYAPKVPEACSLSKSLVRCFTDIVGVLCSSHYGLLHNPEYLQTGKSNGTASRVPPLWGFMCRTITVIFKRTPSWSKYYRNEEMTEWMRDALIFARDILAQRTVFESAAIGASSSTSSSKIRRRMLGDLHEILVELSRWLRLTDEELLHQSCMLIHSLLESFRDAHNPPEPAVLQKLSKQVADVRKRDDSTTSCRLDPAKLAPLEAIISSFDEKDDDDDEVEIVEVKPMQQPKVAANLTVKPKTEQKIVSGERSTRTSATTLPSISKTKPSRLSLADQEKLDTATSMSKFRKASAPSVSAPSRPVKPAVGDQKRAADSDSPSDSDEESAEEESQATALASLTKMQKSPKVRRPVQRRQVKLMDLPNLKKNATEARLAQREEARKTALRFKPDISALHKTLLSWDYEHAGNAPPNTRLQLRHVPDIFSNFNHYRAIFEPLLLLECWAQLLQSKDENPERFQCRITSKQYSGQWINVEVLFDEDLTREWYLTESDVVLLRHPEGKPMVLAKATSFRRQNREPAEAGLRCYLGPDARDPGLSIQSRWQVCKVFRQNSLSTLHREYAALVAAEYYDFADWILRPHLSLPSKVDSREIQQVAEKYKVNEPQAKAIASALKTDGFVLIQGPPGTGKTSTICALISASRARVEKRKILLCAPSNAAIDEIVYRLKEKYQSLKVVRTGAAQAIGSSVKDVSLDALVENKLGGGGQQESSETAKETVAARQEFQTAKQLRLDKIQELQKLRDSGARLNSIEAEVKQLSIKTAALRQRLDTLRDRHTSQSRTMDTARRRARDEVLREADVICSTLSGTGHDNLEHYDFEMVIIDEAAQAIELSSLIPLKYKCNRCVMVGDPQQLPPTVISMEASKFQYNQSLFVRLQKQRPEAVHLLSIQYRMHPEISRLPSKIFYNDRLQDGPDMATKTAQPWHTHSKFGTYRFFDVKGLEESSGRSTRNRTEAQVAVALFNRLRKDFSSVDFTLRVGIVSMYSAQIKELKTTFEQRFGRDILHQVDFRTVDGFQGQEKDVIILSCVRAGPGVMSIGHVKDIRRMNVAITRAKSSLFILGNAATLERSNNTWREIVGDAKSRSFFTEVDYTYFTAPATNAASKNPSQTSSVRTKPKPIKNSLSASVPADLSTPKELKAAASFMVQKPSSISNPTDLDTALSNRGPTRPHAAPEPMAVDEPPDDKQKGKRKQEDVVPELNSTTDNKIQSNGNAPLPPRKRPKQTPTLFIPKNKNKRP